MSKMTIGGIEFDYNERLLTRSEMSITLEPKVAILLQLLLSRSGDLVSREELQSVIYPSHVVTANSINRLVSELRKNLMQINPGVDYIKTVPKAGYKLTLPELTEEPAALQESASLDWFYRIKNKLNYRHYLPAVAFVALAWFGLIAIPEARLAEDKCDKLKGWYFSGSNPKDYLFCLDTNKGIPAPSAFLSHRVKDPKGFATLMQKGWDEEYRGQRVKLSMKIDAKNLTGDVGIFLRADLNGEGPIAFVNSEMQDNLIQLETDWSLREFSLDIPDNASNLAYGVYLEGKGEIRFDNVKLESIGPALAAAKNQMTPPRNLEFSGR